MEVRSIEAVIRALNDAGVRYLIAGGLAVIAHGYTRSTQDMDLILDLGEDNLSRAVAARAT
jgi:predicted nucleotidyltransferase